MAEPSYEELRVALKDTRERLDAREQRLRELGVNDWEPTPVEEKKVVIPTCRHVRENGECCGSVAVTGRNYCYHHLSDRGRRLKMARALARGQRWRLELPPLEDLYAVQVSIHQVVAAMCDGHLDRSLGGVVLYGLQQAATNLRLPEEVWERSHRFGNVARVNWPGFEKEHGLPKDFNIETPPEEAFPLPEAAAELPRAVGPLGESVVTEDDIELEDLKAKDAATYERRLVQLTRKRRRKLERKQRKLARARRVLEADRRNQAARKQPATAPPRPSQAEAEAVNLDPVGALAGEAARKSPQGEAGKEGGQAQDAS